jgi:transposase
MAGQTPVLPHRLCHYQKISAIAAITISPCRRRLGLYLHLYPATDICFEAVVIFLQQLHRHIRNDATLIWDNWGVHRSRQTRAFIETQRWVHVEPLPPYAPELNPVEYFWTQCKYHGLSNHALLGLDCLEEAITEQFIEIRSDQDLLRSFVRQTNLPITLC